MTENIWVLQLVPEELQMLIQCFKNSLKLRLRTFFQILQIRYFVCLKAKTRSANVSLCNHS